MESVNQIVSASVAPVNAPVTGLAYFPLVKGGKKPAIKGNWQDVPPGAYPPVPNYGIALPATLLCLDIDPRNYPPGRDVLQELMAHHRLPQTFCVRTPSGGFHMYFQKPANYKVRVKQKAWPGIDFLSEKFYTVGPGSVLDDREGQTAGVYTMLYAIPAAELPVSLLTTLEHPVDKNLTGGEESLLMLAQYEGECDVVAPPIEGSRSNEAYKLACRGRDLGLPRDTVYRVMRDRWNCRAATPLSDAKLLEICSNAYVYAQNATAAKNPEHVFLKALEGNQANVMSMQAYQDDLAVTGLYASALELDKKGNVKKTLANIVYILRNDPAWRGRIRFNEFAKAFEFDNRPHWREKQLNEGIDVGERDMACLAAWFSSAGHVRLEVGKTLLDTALFAAATAYHPVRDYLDSLTWDGIPRLDTILPDTAGTEDDAYHRAVGRCLLISAVKRIYEPGCKQDYVMVLESNQGTKKSTWVATLGGEWYSANELVRGDKDTFQNLRGRWFVELPEINATFSKHDFNWLKGIISNAVDVYRPSYGRGSKAVPRESIFIATINPGLATGYLKDDENRRYWPIKTGALDILRLEHDRDKYFAEAVHRYRAGEDSWISDPEVEAQARLHQEMRRERDPWVDLLGGWVENHAGGFKVGDVYRLLGGSGTSLNSYHRSRLYRVLSDLGCTFDQEHKIWLKANAWEKLI